jgi:hypothetical protein
VYRRAVAFAAAAAVAATSVATAQQRDTLSTFDQLDLQAQPGADRHGRNPRQDVTMELPSRFLKLVTATNAGVWVWLPKKP